MWHIVSGIYKQGTGRIFKNLKSCPYDIHLLTPLIIHEAHFCNLKVILLFETLPQNTTPYLK
jgi:hypothetical protein